MTGFGQSLISGAFENQIESSMNIRTPTASYSSILKTDCSRNDPGENQCQNPSRSRKAPTVKAQAESFSLTSEGEQQNSASLLTSSFLFLFCYDKA